MQMVTEFARGRPYLAFMVSGGYDPPPAPKRTFPVRALPLPGSWHDSLLTPADLNCSFKIMCCAEVMQWSSLDKQLDCVRSYSSLFILILSHTWLLCGDCAGNLNFFGMCYRPSYRAKNIWKPFVPLVAFQSWILLWEKKFLLNSLQPCCLAFKAVQCHGGSRLLVYCRLATGEVSEAFPELGPAGGGVVIWELRPKTLFCELEGGLHLVVFGMVFVSLLFTLINSKAPLLRPKTFLRVHGIWIRTWGSE